MQQDFTYSYICKTWRSLANARVSDGLLATHAGTPGLRIVGVKAVEERFHVAFPVVAERRRRVQCEKPGQQFPVGEVRASQ
jgi:hypothetical protein